MGIKGFEIRRLHLYAGLVCRIHGIGGEVLSEAIHKQPQRTCVVPLSKVQLQAMWFSKACEFQALEASYKLVVTLTQRGEHVSSRLIPCAFGESGRSTA